MTATERSYGLENAIAEASADAAHRGKIAGENAAIDSLMSADDGKDGRYRFARAWLAANETGDLMRPTRDYGMREPSDYVPSVDLSGQWADEPTPRSLATYYFDESSDGTIEYGPDDVDALCDAYELAGNDAASDAFYTVLMREVAEHDADRQDDEPEDDR